MPDFINVPTAISLGLFVIVFLIACWHEEHTKKKNRRLVAVKKLELSVIKQLKIF